jgi:hypothetical protein
MQKRMVRALAWICGLANEDNKFKSFLEAIPGCLVWSASLLALLIKHDHQLFGEIQNSSTKMFLYPGLLGGNALRPKVDDTYIKHHYFLCLILQDTLVFATTQISA